MNIVKNTYGISAIIDPKLSDFSMINKFGGSSLNRKKSKSKEKKDEESKISELGIKNIKETKGRKLRFMSDRTRSKIRLKFLSFARISKHLTFLTLTFVNEVEDKVAIEALRTFLDNAKKRLDDFQYIWVAERQTKNKVFKNNIHYHLITNKYWSLEKWWPYWLEVQKKFGIVTRDESFNPRSALNVKYVKSGNEKQLINYFTKYVTKDKSKFDCQVWNCSKKISRLYTCFYSGISFINDLERMEAAGQLGGGKLKIIPKEYCNLCIVPLNRITTRLYDKIDDKNRETWKMEDTSKKEVSNESV